MGRAVRVPPGGCISDRGPAATPPPDPSASRIPPRLRTGIPWAVAPPDWTRCGTAWPAAKAPHPFVCKASIYTGANAVRWGPGVVITWRRADGDLWRAAAGLTPHAWYASPVRPLRGDGARRPGRRRCARLGRTGAGVGRGVGGVVAWFSAHRAPPVRGQDCVHLVETAPVGSDEPPCRPTPADLGHGYEGGFVSD